MHNIARITCFDLHVQVHSGVKENDIKELLNVARKQANENHNKKMDTVVFFDEANTTDAIRLIKEIMCDGRLHGKSIPDNLKFIAACNPYRRSVQNVYCTFFLLHILMLLTTCRHSVGMIKKLHSTDFGFYGDTQQQPGLLYMYINKCHGV